MCGSPINHLLNVSIERRTYEFNNAGDYRCVDSDCVEDEGYLCPVCGSRLFWDEDEALDFLNGMDGNEIDDWED